MASKTIIFGSIVILFAVLYQVILKDVIFITFGVGRTYNRIEEYPYSCRRLQSPLLESCEHMVLDIEGRTLYAGCSTSVSARRWSPSGNKYNASARELRDHVAVLNIDLPGEDGFYGLHELEVTGGYKSATGGKDLSLTGFDIEVLPDSRLRFMLINHRIPMHYSVEEAAKELDPTKVGANSTVEVFELSRGSSELQYKKSIVNDAVYTPNAIAATGDGGFLLTNDHESKVGRFRDLEMLWGGGFVSYCDSVSQCHIAAQGQFNYANGIIKGHDGLYYIASSVKGRIDVFALQASKTLVKEDEIHIGMGIDNLSIDSNGDIFVAAFPKILALVRSMESDVPLDVPSTVFRVRKSGLVGTGAPAYEVTKVLEDIEGKFLPSSTTAIHDAKTGNFWLSGVASPFITVCEKLD